MACSCHKMSVTFMNFEYREGLAGNICLWLNSATSWISAQCRDPGCCTINCTPKHIWKFQWYHSSFSSGGSKNVSLWFILTLSRSSLKVKVTHQSSQLQEEDVTKLELNARLSEGFFWCFCLHFWLWWVWLSLVSTCEIDCLEHLSPKWPIVSCKTLNIAYLLTWFVWQNTPSTYQQNSLPGHPADRHQRTTIHPIVVRAEDAATDAEVGYFNGVLVSDKTVPCR